MVILTSMPMEEPTNQGVPKLSLQVNKHTHVHTEADKMHSHTLINTLTCISFSRR